MPSRPALQGASSRERLLKAAKRLFAAQGYEQTATSAIAREAGTSESQLMRYFGGKVGVLDALFEDSWAALNARVARASATTTGSRERILKVVETVVTALVRDPDLATLVLFEGRRLRGGEPRVRLSAGFVAFSNVVKDLVRQGQATREFDPTLDAAAITSSVIGAAEAMLRDRLLARDAGSRTFAEREIQRTLGAILAGFASSAPARGKRATVASRASK